MSLSRRPLRFPDSLYFRPSTAHAAGKEIEMRNSGKKNQKDVAAEHGRLVLRYGAVRETCADLFERLNHLEFVEGPALASRYMMEIGQYEMREYMAWVEVRRWQRRFELRQSAVNANEQPDLLAIEAALDKEFVAFAEKLKAFSNEKKAALAHFHATTLTPQQSTEVRMLYLNAAK